MKKDFYQRLNEKIASVNKYNDLSFIDKHKMEELFEIIQSEILNSINCYNCDKDTFKTIVELGTEFSYYFGWSLHSEESKRKLQYLKMLCSKYGINIYTELNENFEIYASIKNPNKDNKLILQKKK